LAQLAGIPNQKLQHNLRTLAIEKSKLPQRRRKLEWLTDYRISPYDPKKLDEYNGSDKFLEL